MPVEIYHFKQAGKANWGKLDDAIARVEAARASGVDIAADMYTYEAASTGLDAAMPPWVREGGTDAWIKRLKDPARPRALRPRHGGRRRRPGRTSSPAPAPTACC